MKNLPIGISTLSKILENNMVYVDKTEYVYRLAASSGAYFLSRPRRFGKSLLVDTFKSLFEGREELFRGLYIHDKWDWARQYPVIKVDFGGGIQSTRQDLHYKITAQINYHRNLYEISLNEQGITNQFAELIQKLHQKFGTRVVILIDEYDKPLLDNIEKPEVQDEIRDGLRDFYSVIKEQDANVQFVFLTGVSKFSKVSIFSGINNLEDLTLDPQFAASCGYTEADLDTCFSQHLAGVDRELLRTWYNGYNFLGESVYNPFDILLFISKGHSYRSYWFETGTPTFLMKLFKERQYFLPDLEDIVVGDELLSSFELNNLEPATLLFQTGYLTIKDIDDSMGKNLYHLGFPNKEVTMAFNDHLIRAYTDISSKQAPFQKEIWETLGAGKPERFEAIFTRLFAAIPWRNFTNNFLADFEGYYASVLYAFFAAINCTVIPEDISNHGQADLTIILGTKIYVMEIKLVDSIPAEEVPNSALEQIRKRNYARKYTGQPGKQVFELGLVFGKAERNLVQFGWAEHKKPSKGALQ